MCLFCGYWLPSPSFSHGLSRFGHCRFLNVRFGPAAVGHDGVVPTLHVLDSGIETMTCCGIGTSGTGVCFVESEAMHPTVVHGSAIIGGDAGSMQARHDWGWFGGSRGGSGGNSSSGIGAMETSLAGGEFVEAVFVFGGKVHAEFGEGFVGGRVGAPHIASHGEGAH